MATYTTLRQGNGNTEETKKLQQALKDQGYGSYLGSAGVDGIFGSGTAAAVKAFQKANGLAEDGIAGEKTWGALLNPQSSASTPAETTTAKIEAPTFNYTKSDAVTQAEALLQQQLANKPGEYQSTWQDKLNDTINQILNREKFSYDLNGDMLYQQYKDQYTTQGKLAMMDTMGQAAAMTGGYGNSYAQTAGQQAYQGYLQQLNDKVPELYALALDKYNQEGQAMYDQASLMAQMEDQDYGRYRDTLSDYYTDLNYLTENARYMSETEYNQALQDFNIKYSSYWDQTNFDYQLERDKIADQQWQATFDEGVRQYNQSLAESQADRAESARQFDEKQKASAEASAEGSFKKATFARTDDNGNNVFYIDGKEYTFAPGVNPYTGTTNKDTENGTFSNGYQPNNVGGQKLSKSGITDVVNGVTQNVWKTPDGKLWIWDGTQNKYLQYQE